MESLVFLESWESMFVPFRKPQQLPVLFKVSPNHTTIKRQ